MSRSSSPIKLFDLGHWTIGFICPGPGYIWCWNVRGFICSPLCPPWCFPWLLKKKKLFSSFFWMLQAILNKSWRQHPSKQQLYDHFSPIIKTIKVRWTRHAGDYWRSKDELISDIFLWTPSYGRAKEEPPARIYIQQLCANTRCNLEDLPGAMDDCGRGSRRFVLAARWWWWWWNGFI